MKAYFESERVTKNAVRFKEVLKSDLDEPRIGTLYMKKSTLREMGWKEGQRLQVSVDIMEF